MKNAWRLLSNVAVLCACFMLVSVADAGLVRGRWDPGFGSTLPGLNWTVHAELLVPSGCDSQPDGVYNNTSSPCAGSVALGVFLRLFDTGYTSNDWNVLTTYSSAPPDAATYPVCNSTVSGDPYFVARCGGFFGIPYGISNIRIASGNVVGFDGTYPSSLTYDTSFGFPTNALEYGFGLDFTVNGPVLTCKTSTISVACPTGTVGDTTNLTQFLVTYTSNDASVPKFIDETTGQALGAVLDGSGKYLGLAAAVPEPGSLALLLGALGAGWVARRRHAHAG